MCKVRCWRWLFGNKIPISKNEDCGWQVRIATEDMKARFETEEKDWDQQAIDTGTREREFFIDNLLVRIYFIIEMVWWTGLAS